MEEDFTKKQEHIEDLLDDVFEQHQLILFNDDVNTFNWVIESLMMVCNHSYEQAEQCALIVHLKGKYGVKTGPKKMLFPMKQGLIERGLTVSIR